MSRKKPTILNEYTEQGSGKSTQILKSDCLYIVTYQGKPFNLKIINKMFDYPGPKYKKTSFSNPSHAYHLVDKLNEMFECDDFNVVIFQ